MPATKEAINEYCRNNCPWKPAAPDCDECPLGEHRDYTDKEFGMVHTISEADHRADMKRDRLEYQRECISEIRRMRLQPKPLWRL